MIACPLPSADKNWNTLVDTIGEIPAYQVFINNRYRVPDPESVIIPEGYEKAPKRPHPTVQIISGGQTGAEQIALKVGKGIGLGTGGYAPLGYKTETGKNTTLKDVYGLKEHNTPNYPERTRRNVEESDATVLFGDKSIPAIKKAIEAAEEFDKPTISNPTAEELKTFLNDKSVGTLNVVGDRAGSERVDADMLDDIETTLVTALDLPKVDLERSINVYDATQSLTRDEIITKISRVNESIKSPTYDKADKFNDRYTRFNPKTKLIEIIKNRVTDKQQKLFEKLAGGKEKAKEINDKYTNRIKREKGIELHAAAENILRAQFGLEEEVDLKTLKPEHRAVFKNGVINIANTIKENQKKIDPSKEATLMTEVTLYDEVSDTAGSMDVFVGYSDGSVAIYDWKFVNFKRNKKGIVTGITENKFDSFDIQISDYKRILFERYGVTKFRESRIIPVDVQYDFETVNGKKRMSSDLSSIAIGKAQSEHLDTIPVGQELTDDDNINSIIKSLMKLLETAKQAKKKAYDKDKAKARIFELRESIKTIQREKDIQGALFEVKHYTDEIAERVKIQDPENPNYLTNIEEIKDTIRVYEGLLKVASKHSDSLNAKDKKKTLSRIGEASVALKMLEMSVRDALEQRMVDLGMGFEIKGIDVEQSETSQMSTIFTHLSSYSHPMFQLFKKVIDKSYNNTRRSVNKVNDTIKKVDKDLMEWGNNNGRPGIKGYDIMINPKTGNLVSKLSKSFYDARTNAIENQDFTWLKKTYKITEEGKKKYLEDKEKAFNSLERNFKRTPSEANKLKAKWVEDNNLELKNTAWLNTRALARYAEVVDDNKWKDDQYRTIESIPALKNYYDTYTEIMRELMSFLPAESGKGATFVGSIQKDIIDTVSANGLSSFKQMGRSLINSIEYRQDDSTIGMTNLLTGQPDKSIPILFMTPITDTEGNLDLSQKSTDLSRSLLIMSEMAYNYKYMNEIEDTVSNMREYLASQEQVITDNTNKPIRDTLGKMSTALGSSDTLGSFNKFIDYAIYGRKIQSKDFTVELGDKTLSGNKAVMKVMNYFSTKSLAFNVFSAGANAVGASANAYMQGVKGKFYSTSQMRGTIRDLSKFDKKTSAFAKYFEVAQMDLTYEKANKLSGNKLTRWLTVDNMMLLQRKTDDFVDNTITISMGKNYGIDEKGRIKKLSKLPKGAKSILERTTFSEEGLKIDGMTEDGYDTFRSMVMYVAGTVKGTTTDEDINLIQTTLAGKALMQYRSWLPRMAEERFRKTSYNNTIQEIEMGRFRVGFGEFVNRHFLPTSAKFIAEISIGWTGLYKYTANSAIADKVFNEFVTTNPEFLTNFDTIEEARQAFSAERQGQLRALAVELRMYMMVLAAIASMGLDWDDDDQPEYKDYAFTRVLYKLARRSSLELGFFINPKEASQLINKPIALVGLLEQIGSLFTEGFDETRDFVFGENSSRDKRDVSDVAMKLLPIVNSATTLFNAIYDGIEERSEK